MDDRASWDRDSGSRRAQNRDFGEWIERTGGTSRRLVHLSGLDQVIAEVTEAGEQRALLRNGTANVTHVAVDGQMDEQLGSGALAARRYEAFGSVRSGTASTERGFAGRPVEHGVFGLVNFRARHYDPTNGVFLQPDPLGIDAVDVYAYGRSNPYAFIDPTGFDPTAIRSGVPSLSDTVSNAPFGDLGPGPGFDNFATSPAPVSRTLGASGSTIGPQEPAARVFGVFDLFSTSPVSDFLFPNRGPLHYFASGYEDYLVRGLSGQWEPGEEFLAVVPGGPVVRRGSRAAGSFVDLASPARRTHILEGKALPGGRFSGGHRAGTGFPGKSEFPPSWADDQIMHHISDVATDPASVVRKGRGGDLFVSGMRDGVEIEVLIRNGEIWTAYPTSVIRNP